jgi:hypothetical protein
MSSWQDCVVSYFDLIGIREKIESANSEASILMQKFHLLIRKSMFDGMPTHDNVYVWNDSALFLAFPQENADYEKIMRELNGIKPRIDDISPSYAICVKGQAIPEAPCQYDTNPVRQPRFVFLKASSYALANCFEIEKKLKKLKMDWYVDGRIAEKIPAFEKCDKHEVAMFPSGSKRGVFVVKGSIWKTALTRRCSRPPKVGG